MHNLESVLENEMHKILRDFEIKAHYLISSRRSDLVIVEKKKKKKRNMPNSGLAVQVDHWVKLKEGEKRDKYLAIARELKKIWNVK